MQFRTLSAVFAALGIILIIIAYNLYPTIDSSWIEQLERMPMRPGDYDFEEKL